MNINNILFLGKKESKRTSLIDYIFEGNYEKKKNGSENQMMYKDIKYIKDLKVNIMELQDIDEENVGIIRKKAVDEINKGEAYSNLNNRIHSVIYVVSANNFSEFELEEVIRPVSLAANRIVVIISDCNHSTLENLMEVEKKIGSVVSFDEIIRLNIDDFEPIDKNVFVGERKDAMRAITLNIWDRLKMRVLTEVYEELSNVIEQWKVYCDHHVYDKVNTFNIKKTKLNSEQIFTDMLNSELKKEKVNIEKVLKEYVDYYSKVELLLNNFVDDEFEPRHRDVEIVYPEDLTKEWTGDEELDSLEEKFQGKATKEIILEDIEKFYNVAKRQIAIIMETYKNVLA
ncbi:MAG: hypothetical protein ACRDD2_07455 [Sarcina sp.]